MMIDAVKFRPVVSFCIPVYNNAEAAQKIVNGLLVSDDPRFEVVVNDNASTDDTQEVLSQIHDDRFRFYRNDTNLEPHRNWQTALEHGRGTYLFLSMIRDKLYGEKVTDLIDILEQAHRENITLLQDGYEPYRIYNGIDAMIRFLRIDHPTATIFDGEIFHAIPDRKRYFEISDMYPENYVKRDCLLKGKGATIFSGVYDVHHREGYFRASKNSHSTVECGKPLFDMYYAPRRINIQIFELIDMIECEESGGFSENGINRYFTAQFRDLLYRVSIGWYSQSNNGSKYYGQPPRKVTMREMFGNILDAYRNTKTHLQDKGIFSRVKRRIMYRCTAEMLARVFLYASVKLSAKKILAPLGVWKLLQKIKHSR